MGVLHPVGLIGLTVAKLHYWHSGGESLAARCTDLGGRERRAYRDVQIMLVRTGPLPSAHCRRSPPRQRPSRRCAAATLAYLVTTTLMDQAYAPYSCSTKAKCNYHDCANRVCSSSNSNCQDNVWSYDCKQYDASNKACKYDTAGSDNFCPDPSSCPAGTFSANGKNYLGDGACQPCNAGSYSSSPEAQSCTSCTSPPGSYCASGSNSTGGSLCPVGHFCAGSASDKQPCNAGSFSSSSGAHSCTPCVLASFRFNLAQTHRTHVLPVWRASFRFNPGQTHRMRVLLVVLASFLLKRVQAHVLHVLLASFRFNLAQTRRMRALPAWRASFRFNLAQTRRTHVLPVWRASIRFNLGQTHRMRALPV